MSQRWWCAMSPISTSVTDPLRRSARANACFAPSCTASSAAAVPSVYGASASVHEVVCVAHRAHHAQRRGGRRVPRHLLVLRQPVPAPPDTLHIDERVEKHDERASVQPGLSMPP